MKDLFTYSSSSFAVSRHIAESVYPYLTEKKEHCAIFLQFLNCSFKEDKNVLIDKIRALKKEGDFVNREHVAILNSIKNTVVPSEIDCSYLAGFIDAECCLSISKWKPDGYTNFTYKIFLQCNNARFPVFKWAIERFGGSITYYDRSGQAKAKKDQLVWRISGKALSSILPKIKDFLMYKRPVCEELIKFYETTLDNGGARHTEDFRRHYAQVIRIREDIIHKVHQLNRKGLK